MIYLSQMLGKAVIDADNEQIGTISDVAIATGEVFPRVTSLAFLGPDKTPFMLSWRKFVAGFDGERVALNVSAREIRFSYLQPDEVLLHRDLLNKQIVDTQGIRVVRVNDLKLSDSRDQLRLLGAEVGMRGIVRGISPALERLVERLARLVGATFPEKLIAWNYMDLLEHNLSQVRLSVTHKRLHELHPADVADILEQLQPAQRAAVFAHLDNDAAAETISELEDAFQADVIDDLSEHHASRLLAVMDPDDAADIIGDLPYEKGERLLRLMGVEDADAIRSLLGYKEKTAGGIMTSEVTVVTEEMSVEQVIERLRTAADTRESIHYVYVVTADGRLTGVVSLRELLLADSATPVSGLAQRDLFTAGPDEDQEAVAERIGKYGLLALPVVDEHGALLGVVTVDDALEVLEEEADEDLALATGAGKQDLGAFSFGWQVLRRSTWIGVWVVALFGVHLAFRNLLGSATETALYDWPGTGILLAVYATVLMPIVLRAAEERMSRVVAELISGAPRDQRRSLARRLLTEGAVGFGVGTVGGVIAFGLLEIALGPQGLGAAVTLGLATTVSVSLTVMFGGLLAEVALNRASAGKPASSTLLSAASMLFAAVTYVSLSAAGGWLLAARG